MTDTTNDAENMRIAARAYVARQVRNNALAKLAGGFVTWLLAMGMGLCTTYYGAFVLNYHWNWFFVPEGFDPLSLRMRLGFCVIAGLLLLGILTAIAMNDIQKSDDKPSDKDKKSGDEDAPNARYLAFTRVGFLAFAITVSWGTGWFWNWWLS